MVPESHLEKQQSRVLNLRRSHQIMGLEPCASELTESYPCWTCSLFNHTWAICIYYVRMEKCYYLGIISKRAAMCLGTFHLFNQTLPICLEQKETVVWNANYKNETCLYCRSHNHRGLWKGTTNRYQLTSQYFKMSELSNCSCHANDTYNVNKLQPSENNNKSYPSQKHVQQIEWW